MRRRRTSERRRRMLDEAMALIEEGMSLESASAALGISVSTLMRWRRKAARGTRLSARRGPRRRAVDTRSRRLAEELVRRMRGLIGAEALAHTIEGLSRREAATIKNTICSALERERKSECREVTFTTPGVVRGFDAMQIAPDEYWLVASDAAVPYRTAIESVARYDGRAVARFLEDDLRTHGSPLVLRLDRARQHETPEVREVLARYKVLVLHGPPHRPTYYGQLERQNRDHRAWLRSGGDETSMRSMVEAFNASWRRRTLGWRTAEEVWKARPQLTIDRDKFRREVARRTNRIRRRLEMKGKPKDLAERLAIEQALTARGYLRREKRRGC